MAATLTDAPALPAETEAVATAPGTEAARVAPATDPGTNAGGTELDGRDLPWWALFIAVVFAVLGFVAPALWLFAGATFVAWAAGFRYRAADEARWYVW